MAVRALKVADADDEIVVGDYFQKDNGFEYAGMHLLLDLWGCTNLDRPAFVSEALKKAASDCGATILHSHAHVFSPYGGVTGVVVLAESHITIHTWPERGFAAIDVFMCGGCDPRGAIAAIKAAFEPNEMTLSPELRGVVLER